MKVVLPHSQRFADTIPGDFKALAGIVWGLVTLSSQRPNKDFSSPFSPLS
jgi:hypothetical protein